MSNLYFILAILCIAWGIVSAIVITEFVSRRGVKIDFLLYRLLMLKYVRQYYKITTAESGKPGPWFYSYLISMNLALVYVILGIALKYV